MLKWFLCLFVLVSGLPTKDADTDQSAESLLTQVYNMENESHPDSVVVANIKSHVSETISSVESMDYTDRITLPTQLEQAQQRQRSLEDALARAVIATTNATHAEAALGSKCTALSAELESAKIELDTANASARDQQLVIDREYAQMTASMDAIDRDAEILQAVKRKLGVIVTDGSANAGIDPQPLLHQVDSLVSGMQHELSESKEKKSSEWTLTKQRLDLEARPTMDRFSAAKASVSASLGRLGACQTSLADAQEETRRSKRTQEALTQDVEKAKQDVEGIQVAFDKRHQAREERIKFLTSLLAKIQELSERSKTV